MSSMMSLRLVASTEALGLLEGSRSRQLARSSRSWRGRLAGTLGASSPVASCATAAACTRVLRGVLHWEKGMGAGDQCGLRLCGGGWRGHHSLAMQDASVAPAPVAAWHCSGTAHTSVMATCPSTRREHMPQPGSTGQQSGHVHTLAWISDSSRSPHGRCPVSACSSTQPMDHTSASGPVAAPGALQHVQTCALAAGLKRTG